METQTETVRALDENSGHDRPISEKHRLLAHLMLKDGKPFRTAALEAGYSQNTADAGPADMIERCPGFAQALKEESKQIPASQDAQALAVNTLITDLRNGKSRGLERTIEVLGKFKVYDWFVRNSDMQLGVFLGLTEQNPDPLAEKNLQD